MRIDVQKINKYISDSHMSSDCLLLTSSPPRFHVTHLRCSISLPRLIYGGGRRKAFNFKNTRMKATLPMNRTSVHWKKSSEATLLNVTTLSSLLLFCSHWAKGKHMYCCC